MHASVRALALVVAGVLLVGALPAGAQTLAKVYRIAILSHPNPPVRTTAAGIEVFRQGLRERFDLIVTVASRSAVGSSEASSSARPFS